MRSPALTLQKKPIFSCKIGGLAPPWRKIGADHNPLTIQRHILRQNTNNHLHHLDTFTPTDKKTSVREKRKKHLKNTVAARRLATIIKIITDAPKNFSSDQGEKTFLCDRRHIFSSNRFALSTALTTFKV